ncbi:hypothetical protein HanIR_Chr01g0049171 [Helianthus annuus]|nr:hypothetical protein HanIR_Chr01g0049171 [Helianthus annuus]
MSFRTRRVLGRHEFRAGTSFVPFRRESIRPVPFRREPFRRVPFESLFLRDRGKAESSISIPTG